MSFKPQLNKKRKLNETSFESKHQELRPQNLKRRSKTPAHLARGSANYQLDLQAQRRELTKKRLQIRSGVSKIGTRRYATTTQSSKPINYSKCNYLYAPSDLLAQTLERIEKLIQDQEITKNEEYTALAVEVKNNLVELQQLDQQYDSYHAQEKALQDEFEQLQAFHQDEDHLHQQQRSQYDQLLADSHYFDREYVSTMEELRIQEQECKEFDQEIGALEKVLQVERKKEHQYYKETILVNEVKNHCIKRGPFVIGVLRDQLDDCTVESQNFNRLLVVNEQRQQIWELDKVLDQKNPIVDLFSKPDDFLTSVLFKAYIKPDAALPKFKNVSSSPSSIQLFLTQVSALCIGSQTYSSLISALSQQEPYQVKMLPQNGIEFISLTRNEVRFQVAYFSTAQEHLADSIGWLRKLRTYGFQIQNEQQQYLIDKKRKSFGTDCPNLNSLLELFSHKDLVLVLVDLDQGSLLNKELLEVVRQLRQLKFTSY